MDSPEVVVAAIVYRHSWYESQGLECPPWTGLEESRQHYWIDKYQATKECHA